ncbi:MAG: OmpA family protein [Bacteroidales bacterium]|nr:OmpA family protein [Bacteroidales bacterium]
MKTFFYIIVLIYYNFAFCQLQPTEDKSLMKIKVTDFKNKPLSNERIEFISRNTKKSYIVFTNNNGTCEILLPEGETYDINYRNFIEDKNYSTIYVKNEKGAFTYNLNIKFEPEKIFILRNVYFETGKSTLLPESFPALNTLYEALKAKPTLKIEIAGHTDNVGKYEDNLILSQNRANAVKQYLIAKGIKPDRLIAKGYADTQPIADNETPEGRAMNRRVEIRIIEE